MSNCSSCFCDCINFPLVHSVSLLFDTFEHKYLPLCCNLRTYEKKLYFDTFNIISFDILIYNLYNAHKIYIIQVVEFEEYVKYFDCQKYGNSTKFGKFVITRKVMLVFIWYFTYISIRVFAKVSNS